MKYLKPLLLKPDYYKKISVTIQDIFDDVFYKQIVKIILEKRKRLIGNDNNAVIEAIKSGKIYYDNGAFHGEFDALISKGLKQAGGTFNKRTKAYALEVLPAEYSIAIAQTESDAQELNAQLLEFLGGVNLKTLPKQEELYTEYQHTVKAINTDFVDSIKSLAIAPELTPGMQDAISKQWATNLDLYIKDWCADNILELREKIGANTFRGQRAANMVKIIQDNYNVSRSKAEFLARQETSLLMSKFRETRYKDIGSRKYRWSGTNDGRERPDHIALNNHIFSWESPPVVDKRTGRRAHPGEDFGCRCVAVAFIE